MALLYKIEYFDGEKIVYQVFKHAYISALNIHFYLVHPFFMLNNFFNDSIGF